MDTSRLFRVDGMVAVVTGGGTGIGLVMARALAGAGADKVYILGRRRERLEAAAAATPGLVPVECDVTSQTSLQRAVDTITRDAGRVNLLVANSGVTGPTTQRFAPGLSIAELRQRLFADVAIADFTAAFEVNVAGAYFTMLAFLELLDAGNRHALAPPAKDGDDENTAVPPLSPFGAPDVPAAGAGAPVPAVQSQVIFTSSIAAYSRMSASTPAYAGSKAAIAHLAKHASTNLAPYGIRVNALAPGRKSSPSHSLPLPLLFVLDAPPQPQ